MKIYVQKQQRSGYLVISVFSFFLFFLVEDMLSETKDPVEIKALQKMHTQIEGYWGLLFLGSAMIPLDSPESIIFSWYMISDSL